jgi:transposase
VSWRWITGRSYSLDLRVRIAGFVEAGHSRRAAARHFGVSDSCAIKLVRRPAALNRPSKRHWRQDTLT